MKLREYQADLIGKIRLAILHGHKSIVSVLGCGGGKSIIQAEIARSATVKGNRVLFLVHRKELCEQITRTFTAQGVDMDLCSVSMVQTVSRHIDKLPKPRIIITDEAHHSTAASYKKIYAAFPEACRLGFTATPCRLNKGGLGEVYDKLITSVTTQWLIEHNYLSPYKYYSVKLADTSGLHIKAGDYKGDIGVEHEHEAYIIEQQQFALLLKDARQYLIEAVDGFRAFGKELDEKCELNLDCSKCQLNNGGNCRSWKHAKAVIKLIGGKQSCESAINITIFQQYFIETAIFLC